MTADLSWVLLTQGTRPNELRAAVDSLRTDVDGSGWVTDIIVVSNGGDPVTDVPGAHVIRSDTNLGVPGGRALGLASTDAPIVGFLDDDARMLTSGVTALLVERFDRERDLAAIGFRIVDEGGETARRHIPRVGDGSAGVGGPVVTFLGGACALRRSAYIEVGGYWEDLVYAHEELDLAWRLHDGGHRVSYDTRIEVFHPRTSISRHADGWSLTGRNRVMIARRNLPWPIAVAHVAIWLVVGVIRTPDRACRIAYVRGWRTGWSAPVARRPMAWRTVLRLARIGRPPVV